MYAKPVYVDGKILAIYQKRLIDLYKEKITFMVEFSSNIDSIIQVLCNGNSIINVDENMTLQKQTLLLAIYNKYIVEKPTNDTDKILQKIGDYLVFCGLYNIQYDNTYFELYYNKVVNHIKKLPQQGICISQLDIITAIYGLNSLYTKKFTEICWARSNFTQFEQIIHWVRETKDACEIFTLARCLNHDNVKPRGLLHNQNICTENILQYINGSEFLNRITTKINTHTLPFNCSENNMVCINKRKGHYVKCFTNTGTYIAHSLIHRIGTLFAVVMGFEFEATSIFKNMVLVNDVFDAINTAKDYDNGIILMFPKEAIENIGYNPVDVTTTLSYNEFQKYIQESSNAKTTYKYITHTNPLNQKYYYITNDDLVNTFFRKSNLLGILHLNSTNQSTVFNQK